MNKEITKLEAEIDRLKSQLYNTDAEHKMFSVEEYNIHRYKLEIQIEMYESMIIDMKEKEKLFGPPRVMMYIFCIIAALCALFGLIYIR